MIYNLILSVRYRGLAMRKHDSQYAEYIAGKNNRTYDKMLWWYQNLFMSNMNPFVPTLFGKHKYVDSAA